jgi:Fe-S cluster biogenesis protein NfuA/iron-sulfur cluster repair protein YtfE (RIC family)
MNPLYKKDVLKALEQIRPYIKADGGDVELVDIADNGMVSVRLTGNCVGCASAGVTVFEGIQSALQGQLAWVTGVQQVEHGAADVASESSITASVQGWQDQGLDLMRQALSALEELRPGAALPEVVLTFLEAARGRIASLLKLEEDVLYGAAETMLGMTSGPVHVLRKEHELLQRLFSEFAAATVRFGAPDGPGARELFEKLQRLARTFDQHLQKERSGLFGPLNQLPEDFKRELREDIARHAAHRGLLAPTKATS